MDKLQQAVGHLQIRDLQANTFFLVIEQYP